MILKYVPGKQLSMVTEMQLEAYSDSRPAFRGPPHSTNFDPASSSACLLSASCPTPSTLLLISSLWWNQDNPAHQTASAIDTAIIAHIPCCVTSQNYAFVLCKKGGWDTHVEPGCH